MRRCFNPIPKVIREYLKNYKRMAEPEACQNNSARWFYLLSTGKFNLIYQTYHNRSFDWKKMDPAVIKEFRDMKVADEGALLDTFLEDLRLRTQVNFLASIMKRARAKRVLETGTHKAMFCYMAYLCSDSVIVDTFGDLPGSQKAADVLNKRYGCYVHFHLGDSSHTLSNFFPDYQIDFAWIDGGHSFEVCFSDLMNCRRLGIPSIAVDDYKSHAGVKKAVDKFMEKNDYSLKGVSNLADYRGIAHLTKNS